MRRWGGCGILPSGAYYAQVSTTVLNDRESVDGHALSLLPEMVARYVEPIAVSETGADGAPASVRPGEPPVRAR